MLRDVHPPAKMVLNHLAGNIRQSEVAALVTAGEAPMIEPQAVPDCFRHVWSVFQCVKECLERAVGFGLCAHELFGTEFFYGLLVGRCLT